MSKKKSVSLPLRGSDFPLALRRHLVEVANRNGPCAFDLEVAEALLSSLSLDLTEKNRAVEAGINATQRKSLLAVWSDERKRFATIYLQEPVQTWQLISRAVVRGFALAQVLGWQISPEVEEALTVRMARRMRKRINTNDLALEVIAFQQPLTAWHWRHLLPSDHPAWQICPSRTLETD